MTYARARTRSFIIAAQQRKNWDGLRASAHLPRPKKFFQKTLDKPGGLWYNSIVGSAPPLPSVPPAGVVPLSPGGFLTGIRQTVRHMTLTHAS